MNTPIIDPSTLTEEQRKEIKGRYALLKMGVTECEADALSFVMDDYEWLFGKEFFEKGECNENRIDD